MRRLQRAIAQRAPRYLDVGSALLLLFGARFLDQGLRSVFGADVAVGGPIVAGINADTKVFVFTLISFICWALAEMFRSLSLSPAATAVAGALGAFYLGAAFAVALGVRDHSWLVVVVDQALPFWVGAAMYGSAFDLRFQLAKWAAIVAALLCLSWWILIGLAATHEGQGLYN
jgi:hypothetical protein